MLYSKETKQGDPEAYVLYAEDPTVKADTARQCFSFALSSIYLLKSLLTSIFEALVTLS
jgi:hypothetical protein